MPQTKSAKKKLRVDVRRRRFNLAVKNKLKAALKKFKNTPSPDNFRQLTSILDKAAKKNIIKKQKAARLKSRLSKLVEKLTAVSRKSKKTKKKIKTKPS